VPVWDAGAISPFLYRGFYPGTGIVRGRDAIFAKRAKREKQSLLDGIDDIRPTVTPQPSNGRLGGQRQRARKSPAP
jgi:hypothetical protein